MAHGLSFNHLYEYDRDVDGISAVATVSYEGKSVRIPVKLDTGASFCIFDREYGDSLGLTVEDGAPKDFSTAGGPFRAFGHSVTISAFGYEVECVAYFAKHRMGRNVLGRAGFIEKLKIGLIDYDGRLYTSHYNDDGDD